ncbi:unnamed protein product [Cochlearia groenlandica]
MGDNQERVYPIVKMEINKTKTLLEHGDTMPVPIQQQTRPFSMTNKLKTSLDRRKTEQLPIQQPVMPIAIANKSKTSVDREETSHLPIQRSTPPIPMADKSITSQAQGKINTSQLPIRRPIPPHAMSRTKKRNLCCKCFCWVLSLVIIALIALAVAIGVIYFVFHPKLPRYDVNSLRVTNLGINLDLSLSAMFNVEITARNPNKKIGIYYEKGGLIGVWYTGTKLCEGPIPKLYQGHKNVTKLNVDLTGRAQYGNTVLSALQQQQQTGRVPLDLKVDAPVIVELGKLKLKKIRILGNCKLVVDSLSTNNRINIKASDCSFRLKL